MGCTFGPVILLSGVTGAGAGSTVDLGGVFNDFSLISWATGSGSAGLKLEGSHDGSHWVLLTDVTPSGGGSASYTNLNGGPYVRYLRGNCTSIDSGVSATLTVAAAQS